MPELEDEYGEVKEISKIRLNGNGKEYWVSWEDGSSSWEPESCLLLPSGFNRDERRERAQHMKELAEELGNWEGLSWKEVAEESYGKGEWVRLMGDAHGVLPSLTREEVHQHHSQTVGMCMQDFLEHAEGMGGGQNNVEEKCEERTPREYDGPSPPEIKCFYLKGGLEEEILVMEDLDKVKAVCEGTRYEELTRHLGEGENLLVDEDCLEVQDDCVLRLLERWKILDEGGEWGWEEVGVNLKIEEKEKAVMSAEVTREWFKYILALHALHGFDAAALSDGSRKEIKEGEDKGKVKLAQGVFEGLGRISGGSLPGWMEIVDAELEAIFQFLKRQEDNKKVLLLVDCVPALLLVKGALRGQSSGLEGKAREMTLRRIRKEIERLELVVFFWIPSHIGIIPQSYADCIAKCCLGAPMTEDISCVNHIGLKLGQLRRKKDGSLLLKKVFKSAVGDAQPSVMRKLLPNTEKTWMDRALLESGDLLQGEYWTKLVTHTSMKGKVSSKMVEFMRQLRSRRIGVLHDRSWSVMKEGVGKEKGKYSYTEGFDCPCCGQGKATVAHVLFECQGSGEGASVLRCKAAKELQKSSSLIKKPKEQEGGEAHALTILARTAEVLMAPQGTSMQGEDCIKPLCGLLPRPVELTHDGAFDKFMEHYVQAVRYIQYLVDTWKEDSREERMWISDVWKLRHQLIRLALVWKSRAKVLARDRMRRVSNLTRVLHSNVNAQRRLRLDIDEEEEGQGSEPDSQQTSINESEGGVRVQVRRRKRRKVTKKRSLGRRSWVEASKRFKPLVSDQGVELQLPSLPG